MPAGLGKTIKRLLGEDVDHARAVPCHAFARSQDWLQTLWWQRTKTIGHADYVIDVDPLRPSPPAYWRLLAVIVGLIELNPAILRTKATKLALPDHVLGDAHLGIFGAQATSRFHTAGCAAIDQRRGRGLGRGGRGDPCPRADERLLRAPEARLLYDLQKVCIEHERGLFTLDLLELGAAVGPSSTFAGRSPCYAMCFVGETSANRLASVECCAVVRRQRRSVCET